MTSTKPYPAEMSSLQRKCLYDKNYKMTVGKITRGGDAMTSGTLYLYPAKM